jgi:hypothetical protein
MNRPQQAMTMRSCSRGYPAQFSLFASRGQTPIELFLHPEKKELAHATHDADLNHETNASCGSSTCLCAAWPKKTQSEAISKKL